MKVIQGVCPVIAGPFTQNGDVDYAGLEALVRHLIGIGAHGMTLFGIASEFHKLTDREKEEMAERFLAIIKPSPAFSMLSVTDHSTEVAVRRARHYQAMGADCLMLLPPFFLGPNVDHIRRHMHAVLEAVEIPVLVQYAPGETKLVIPVEEMAGIAAKYPHAHFKIEPNPPMDYIRALLALAPDSRILLGYAGLYMLDVLEAGGKGTMPGCSFAEIYLAIHALWTGGKQDEARSLHEKLMHYVRRWMSHAEFIIRVEKIILARRGILGSDYCREPAWELAGEDAASIDRFLAEFAEYLS
ncbi:dihydrodipicolinate synthase family protein [Desulfovibrio sp. OttesenSCG-928-I05]|nr:dihydrodipicolinate synthase family protein [Desulfovibrio sp. OttesenSCG-928-I05]